MKINAQILIHCWLTTMFILLLQNISDRIPTDPIVRSEWEAQLQTQQCGSSNLICIEHFDSDDYTIASTGKIYLKSGAVPTVFDIYLVEVDENGSILNTPNFDRSQSNECSNAPCKEVFVELQKEKSMNVKLLKDIKQIRWNHKSIKDVRIDHLKQLNSKQSKEISALKKEIAHYKDEHEKLQATYAKMNGILDKPEVNIFH